MIPLHLLFYLFSTLFQAAVYVGLGRLLGAWFGRPVLPLTRSLATVVRNNWVFNLVFYVAVVGGTLAFLNHRRFREKEKLAGELRDQLAAAQLQSLRVQLQPHFLFNVLNTISSYIYEDPDTAVKIVARLSELLRSSLDSQNRAFIPLAQELAIAETYLEIERLRFSDRLQVRIDVPGETRRALVPSFLLQPLLENAMRHGIAGQIEGGTVEIVARRLGETLSLQVQDDGAGARPDRPASTGIGLGNTRSRLERLYGADHTWRAGNRPGGGFEVEIAIPFRSEPEPLSPGGGA
jgi:LytS/YehU family sensor histidine kinase